MRRDQMTGYKRSLCLRVLQDVHPYYWTEATPTCLECIAEDR